MALVRILGLKRLTRNGKAYVYAWRGGPRLFATEGTPEFLAEYARAAALKTALPGTDSIAGLILAFRASRRFRALAPASRAVYERFIPEILSAFGSAPVAAFADPRIRRDIRAWHEGFAADRAADKALGCLSAILGFAVADGLLAVNPAGAIEKRYARDPQPTPASEEEIAAMVAAAPAHVAFALRLIALTGLARADAVALTIGQIGPQKIVLRRRKSRMRAQPPVTPELAGLLAELDRARPSGVMTVLWSSRGLPWTADGLGHAASAVFRALGSARTLHDLRASYACRLIRAGMGDEEAADTMGWSAATVRYIRRHYVDDEAIFAGRIARLGREES